MTKREQLINLGFKELPHKNIGNNIVYDLGRNREISISSIDTPNELVCIMELDPDTKIGTDLVVLSNYDYDGYMPLKDICHILYGMTKNPNFLIKIEEALSLN